MASLGRSIAPKSDQTNADDFLSGPRIITIRDLVIYEDDGREKYDVYYEGDGNKPWKPCLTMRRVLYEAWGDDSDHYIGRRVKLFRDPTVNFGREKGIGGIRVSHLSHIKMPMNISITVTKGKKAMWKVEPLAPEEGDVDLEALKTAAQTAASGGMKSLEAFWNKQKGPQKKALTPHMNGLKQAAAVADEPPVSEEPSQEELDAMSGHSPDAEQLDREASEQDRAPDPANDEQEPAGDDFPDDGFDQPE